MSRKACATTSRAPSTTRKRLTLAGNSAAPGRRRWQWLAKRPACTASQRAAQTHRQHLPSCIVVAGTPTRTHRSSGAPSLCCAPATRMWCRWGAQLFHVELDAGMEGWVGGSGTQHERLLLLRLLLLLLLLPVLFAAGSSRCVRVWHRPCHACSARPLNQLTLRLLPPTPPFVRSDPGGHARRPERHSTRGAGAGSAHTLCASLQSELRARCVLPERPAAAAVEPEKPRLCAHNWQSVQLVTSSTW